MNSKLYLYSHNPSSNGARDLCSALGARRIRHEGSKFVGGNNKIVINWGSTNLPPEVRKCVVLNEPEAVEICSNKLAFFKTVNGICNIPDFTDDINTAKSWVDDKNTIVFCRTKSRGSGGDGIIEATSSNDLVNCKLYTKYIPKRDEYRIHICKGEVFLSQRKALSGEVRRDNVNWHIRNHAGGFIFVRNDVKPPKCVIDEALKAFNAIKGLTFGSVDVIYNEHRNTAYVLEINTASGLQGETINDYVKALKGVV